MSAIQRTQGESRADRVIENLSQPPNQMSNPGILVVDDDIAVCRILHRMLSEEQYTVQTSLSVNRPQQSVLCLPIAYRDSVPRPGCVIAWVAVCGEDGKRNASGG
jgi:hypothetical protein